MLVFSTIIPLALGDEDLVSFESSGHQTVILQVRIWSSPLLEVQVTWYVLGFKPRTPMEERLARMCVLPLLLAGVLGAPNMETEELAVYLRELILQSSLNFGAWTPSKNPELIDSIRFLWYAVSHHSNALDNTLVKTIIETGNRTLPSVNLSAQSFSLVYVYSWLSENRTELVSGFFFVGRTGARCRAHCAF